jgi:hypothetical protein
MFVSAGLLAQTNAVPFVSQPLVPTAVAPGSAGFTLTVNGSGFVSGSVVKWNGSSRTTSFVNSSQLTASILATDVSVAGTASVTVSSPAPGGGVSNTALFPIAVSRATLSFSTAELTVGTNPAATYVADVNGDGKPDIIAANNQTSTVGVLLGNGDGTFRPEVDYATGLNPEGVTVADFNGDGRLDLAVTNSNGGSVSILLGNGDGTFQPHLDYGTAGTPLSVVAADLNGDGKLDLVIGNDIGDISVLLGNGDGTFQPYKTYAHGGGQTFGVALGDFNHDGFLDVATANVDVNTISILLGNGDGTFRPYTDYSVGNGAFGISTADFNGDGNLDLAVPNGNSSSVSILLGRGDGTFQAQVEYSTASTPFGIAVQDINGDGHLDIAVTTSPILTSFSVLLGNGDGTFQPYVAFDAGGLGNQIAAGDFNRDGLIDFAALSSGVESIIQDLGTVIALSPNSLTFATQLVGTVSGAKVVTLTNTGTATVTIGSVSVASVNFALTNKCGPSIKAGQSCNLLVYFTPTAAGTLTDTLSVFDTGGGSPQTVPLSGTGTIVTLSAKSLNFGAVTVGHTSPPQKVILTNKGSSRLSFTQISISGPNKKDYSQVNACGTGLAAGESCTTDVWFTPIAKGVRNATLNFYDNGGGSPQTVTLTGTGQ